MSQVIYFQRLITISIVIIDISIGRNRLDVIDDHGDILDLIIVVQLIDPLEGVNAPSELSSYRLRSSRADLYKPDPSE